MNICVKASAAALLISSASSAFAAADASADGADQREIVVTGERLQYGIRKTSTATKTNTDIRNVPQAVTVISEAQIEDQQLRSIGDLLTFVPGATPGTGEGNRDQMTLRGNNTTADFFVDGVRDDVQYFRDFYNVDRVEVLKGSNAMIFGRGGGGGVVNRVLKRPSLNNYRQVTASGDSFGGARFTGDFDQSLGAGSGFRLNAMFEDGESFRHHVGVKRYGFNPTAAIELGSATRIDVGYERFHDRRVADRGVPAEDKPANCTLALPCEPLRGYRRTFFGDPDNSYSRADVNLVNATVEHEFARGLTVRSRTLYGDYEKFYQNIYPTAFNRQKQQVTLGAYNSRNDRTNLFNQTDLIWENRLGGVDQTILLGFELGRQKARNKRLTGKFGSSTSLVVPISEATRDVDVVFSRVGSDSDNRVKATIAAAYIQDQIRVSPAFEIVAGLRFDSFKLNVDDFANNALFTRRDELVSPRLGLIAKPTGNLSLYASYSRSYLPQSGDQFSGLTVTTETLKPERFDNYELGAKWEPLSGLLATAAVYQLDRTNTRATDPADSSRTVLSGAQRSRGVELGLERSVTGRWLVSAGYAWQKAKVTRSTTACVTGDCEVPLVPRHSFSLWNRYDFTKQMGVGLGIVARSKSFTSLNNTVRLPGYTRLDGALFYTLPGGVKVQINAENLLGAHYFPTAHNDNNIAPGAPRTIKATLGYSF